VERRLRLLTGVVFIIVGVHYTLTHIYEVRWL